MGKGKQKGHGGVLKRKRRWVRENGRGEGESSEKKGGREKEGGGKGSEGGRGV